MSSSTCLALAAPDGDPSRVDASVELVAPAACGTRAQLISGIVRRSERIHIAATVQSRHVRVRVERNGGELVVELAFEQPNGRRSSRTLRAPSCDEALDAAALVAALSLDPTASTAPAHELPPAPPDAAQSDEPAPKPPAATAPRDEPEAKPDVSDAEHAADEARRLVWSAGVGFAATWQPAPAPMPGVGAFALLRYERASFLSPAVRLTLAHFGRGGFSASRGVGEASFQLDTATLELCPLRLGGARLSLAPCALASGGQLRAAGEGALEARSLARPWWALGASALALARVSDSVELQGGLAIGKPLIRDTFQIEPLVVHAVRPWVVTVGLGAGFVFR